MVLFELGESRKEAPAQAIACGLDVAQVIAQDGSPLFGLKLHLGSHTGVLPTQQVAGEALDIAQAVANASPAGSLLVSHATYSRARTGFQFERQPSIRQPGNNAPVQIYLVAPVQ